MRDLPQSCDGNLSPGIDISDVSGEHPRANPHSAMRSLRQNWTPYHFPGFPEKMVSLLVNGTRTTEYLHEFFCGDGVSRAQVSADIARLIERGIVRMDDAGEIALPRGDKLMADIANSPTVEEVYAAPKQTGHDAEKFDAAFNG